MFEKGGHYLLTSNTGFAISSLLYPAFILIITIVVVTIIIVTQSTFSSDKLTSEISGNLSDNNTMKSLKENVENAVEESSTTGLVYNATSGIIFNTPFSTNINTTNWNGKVYTSDAGDKLAYIDNGTYCAFQLPGMSGVAVYNTGICVDKMKAYTGIKDLVCEDPGSIKIIKIGSATELPTVADDYTIAVVTSVKVSGYKISNNEPSNPTKGMVFFKTTDDLSGVKIKTSTVDLPIYQILQYDYPYWNNVTAYEYYNSRWNILKTYHELSLN